MFLSLPEKPRQNSDIDLDLYLYVAKPSDVSLDPDIWMLFNATEGTCTNLLVDSTWTERMDF